MNARQQVLVSTTPLTAALALVAALALGSVGGYALSALGQPQAGAAAETRLIANPGIGLHRADVGNDEQVVTTADSAGAGRVAARNPGIGLHRLDREELP